MLLAIAEEEEDYIGGFGFPAAIRLVARIAGAEVAL
jgi:hypothetical protein